MAILIISLVLSQIASLIVIYYLLSIKINKNNYNINFDYIKWKKSKEYIKFSQEANKIIENRLSIIRNETNEYMKKHKS